MGDKKVTATLSEMLKAGLDVIKGDRLSEYFTKNPSLVFFVPMVLTCLYERLLEGGGDDEHKED